MKLALLEPVVPSTDLKDGFWPATCVQASLADRLAENGEVHKEFREDDAYVRPLCHRPQPSF